MRQLSMPGLTGLVATVVVAALSFATPAAAQFTSQRADGAPNVGGTVDRRQPLIDAIVAKWGAFVVEAYHTDASEWAGSLAPLFASASPETLRKALSARTFTAMNDALLQRDDVRVRETSLTGVASEDQVARLGDAAADLTYVPITPCRIIDTRVAGGAIAATTVRSFDVTAVGNFAFQGGESSNCGIGGAGGFAAAAINFTVVSPAGAGFITAFPYLATQPTAATLNYNAGDVRGNLAIVKLDQGSSVNELSVYSFAQTHLVADIVGYFITPEPTPVECVEVSSAGTTIPAGGSGTQITTACTAGYTITSGGCSMSTYDGRVVTTRTFDTGHFCAFRNEGGSSVDVQAHARCCRVPGR